MRLLNGYVIQCDEVIQNEQGEVTELRCIYLPETLGGKKPEDGRKVKGIIHWVSAAQAVTATVREYDRLFNIEKPGSAEDVTQALNPDSLNIIKNAYLEPSLAKAKPGEVFQFNRVGYFCADALEHKAGELVFNRVVTLRDGWVKV